MKIYKLAWLIIAVVSVGLLSLSGVLNGDDSGIIQEAEAAPSTAEPVSNLQEITGDVARDRAKVMQDLYSATLTMLHQRYFHRDRAVLPARAMQDIFKEVESRSGAQARWISASLPPMSIDHAPESDFEKKAAKEIAAGTPAIETFEDGYYRRAVAIPLTGGCLGCHEGLTQSHVKKQFAGLVVSIPLRTANGGEE